MYFTFIHKVFHFIYLKKNELKMASNVKFTLQFSSLWTSLMKKHVINLVDNIEDKLEVMEKFNWPIVLTISLISTILSSSSTSSTSSESSLNTPSLFHNIDVFSWFFDFWFLIFNFIHFSCNQHTYLYLSLNLWSLDFLPAHLFLTRKWWV